MAIPKIDEQNITAAIKYIDEHGIPDKDKSTQYVLVTEEGKQYPPKYVTMEHLTYKRENGPQYVIYAWNLFSTLYFVQECLKRFGKENDKFILVYRDKTEQEKNQVATDASVVEEEKKTVMVLCIALQLNVILFKYANEILAYRGKYS